MKHGKLASACLIAGMMVGCERSGSNSSPTASRSPGEPAPAGQTTATTQPQSNGAAGRREMTGQPTVRTPATGPGGGTMADLPAGHPPIPQPELPAGHPAIPQQGQLPAGHPAVAQQGQGQMPGMPGMPGAGEVGTGKMSAPGAKHTGGGIAYQLPAKWAEEEGQGMRFATIKAENIDIIVNHFPGNVGGELANINRWRSQVQLPPLTQEQIAQNSQKVQVGGGTATVVDFAATAPNNERIVAAIIPDPAGDRTWFLKLYGPGKRVEQNKAGFMDLIKSIQLGEGK